MLSLVKSEEKQKRPEACNIVHQNVISREGVELFCQVECLGNSLRLFNYYSIIKWKFPQTTMWIG